MANICLYKIKLKGSKKACEAFMYVMPSYGMDFEIFIEEGTEDNYTLGFTGDCKWSVSAYTSTHDDVELLTEDILNDYEKLDKYYYYPLEEKSVLFNLEIFCNSKDIDDGGYAYYEHYKDGKRIFDECPKELHIKRGRDYDEYSRNDGYTNQDYNPDAKTCKVRFTDNKSYWYMGDYNVGDLVHVEGKKEGLVGIVKETSIFSKNAASCKIVEFNKNVQMFESQVFEDEWSTYKPTQRKEYLREIGFDETLTKKQYLSLLESLWIGLSLNDWTWEQFVKKYTKL